MTGLGETERVQIAVDGPGPVFLGLTSAERNRRLAARAAAADPDLAGTLRLPHDVVVTRALFEVLPHEGTWQVRWHPSRPPLAWQAASGGVGPPLVVSAPAASVFDLSSAASRRDAAWQMLRLSGKRTDGWLSRNVHRKVSRVCSYVLLRLGLRADHATFLTFGVGVVSAALMAQTTRGTMIAGAFLFWFASIADGIDGEMARLSLSESARGEQLDTLVDHATHILCFAGALIGWYRQGIGSEGAALAVAVAIALPVTLVWTMHVVRRASGAQEFFVDTKPMEFGVIGASQATGSPVLRVVATLFVLLRREALSLAFFLVSLVTGWRGVYPALLAAGILFVLATLVVYNRPIEAAIRTRAGRS